MTAQDDDIAATAQMCAHCFDVLLQKLHPPSSDIIISTSTSSSSQYTPPNVTCPLFVTWEKCQSPTRPPQLSKVSTPASSSITTDDEEIILSTHSTTTAPNHTNCSIPAPASPIIYELRGCIGTLAPRQLQHALSEFAITSALHDQRFHPISIHELPLLRVGVSLLVKYEECQDFLDWVVGVHGIIIKFGAADRGIEQLQQQYYSATFLPEVAKEQSWTPKETILQLIRKAGYRGKITNNLLAQIQCTRYQSSKCRMSYQEYVAESSHYGGKDPLSGSVDYLMAAAVAAEEDEVDRKSRVKPCVNL